LHLELGYLRWTPSSGQSPRPNSFTGGFYLRPRVFKVEIDIGLCILKTGALVFYFYGLFIQSGTGVAEYLPAT
jgi:hypothetical protein